MWLSPPRSARQWQQRSTLAFVAKSLVRTSWNSHSSLASDSVFMNTHLHPKRREIPNQTNIWQLNKSQLFWKGSAKSPTAKAKSARNWRGGTSFSSILPCGKNKAFDKLFQRIHTEWHEVLRLHENDNREEHVYLVLKLVQSLTCEEVGPGAQFPSPTWFLCVRPSLWCRPCALESPSSSSLSKNISRINKTWKDWKNEKKSKNHSAQ